MRFFEFASVIKKPLTPDQARVKSMQTQVKNTQKAIKESSKQPQKPADVEQQPTHTKPSRVRKADTQGGYAMTKEEKNLSDDLSKNRGSLPVPISGRFRVVGHFGQQQHEDLKYVVTNNNGVDIQGDPGADARAAFGGVVSKVFAVPGYNSSVIVRHGNFLTVYSNLSRVYVSAGDRVSTRQALGKVFSDPDYDNQTILHFQIWKETTKQNPESWINF
jgi:murein DD-endopeptidase MepM/ murein hydrolase activator NlpD